MKISTRQWVFVFFGFTFLMNAGISAFVLSRIPDVAAILPGWLVPACLLAALLGSAALAYLLSVVLTRSTLTGNQKHAVLSEEACQRLVYVGADCFREGRTCGDIMGQMLNGRGQVAMVTGHTGQSLEIRKTGFLAILEEKYPGIQVVARIEGHNHIESIESSLSAALKRCPDLAGIYVVDGDAPVVVARALLNAGKARKIKLVCHDLVDSTMRALHEGIVTATISQDPFAQGHDPVIYLYNYLAAGQLPPRSKMTTAMDRITIENYRLFWDPQRGEIESDAARQRRARPVDRLPSRPLRIIFLGREDTAFFTPVKQGALAAAAELKDRNTLVEWYDPALSRGSTVYGVRDYGPAIAAYQAKKYDAIVVPIFDNALVPYINRAVAAGIPVAVYNSEPDNLKSLMSTLINQSQQLRDISVALAQSAADSGDRARQINESIGDMNQSLAAEVQSAVLAIASTRQIADAITLISQGAQEQTQAAGSVSEAVRDISKAVEGTNQTAFSSEQTAGQAVDTAQQGAKTIQQTLRQIESISAAVRDTADKIHALNQISHQIDGIVSTVNSMAEQTNMLALNATIEAARAGQNGLGFAVVAKEIRTLAEQSKKSTKEIASLIRAVQVNSSEMVETVDEAMRQAQTGGQLATQAGQSLDALLKSAEAMREQTGKVVLANVGVVNSLDHLTQANQRVTAVIVENAGATRQVNENIHQTVEMVNQMTGISKENANAIDGIHIRSDDVAAQSQHLKESIASLVLMAEEMQGVVAAFKINQGI